MVAAHWKRHAGPFPAVRNVFQTWLHLQLQRESSEGWKLHLGQRMRRPSGARIGSPPRPVPMEQRAEMIRLSDCREPGGGGGFMLVMGGAGAPARAAASSMAAKSRALLSGICSNRLAASDPRRLPA